MKGFYWDSLEAKGNSKIQWPLVDPDQLQLIKPVFNLSVDAGQRQFSQDIVITAKMKGFRCNVWFCNTGPCSLSARGLGNKELVSKRSPAGVLPSVRQVCEVLVFCLSALPLDIILVMSN